MQEYSVPRRGGAAFIWKWGAIYGAVLGVLHILLSLLSLGLLQTVINFVVWLVGFFLIGMFAARQTGRAGTGALVGLVTGLIGGLIVVLFGVIQIVANGPQITQALTQATQNAQAQGQTISTSELRVIAVAGIVIGLVVTVAFELGLGAGIGALGGLAGRGQGRRDVPPPPAGAMWAPPPSAGMWTPPPSAGTPPPSAGTMWTPPPSAPPPYPNQPQE